MMAIPRDLKELNKKNIKSILRQQGAMTKAEIAEVTGLSVVTVNKLIRDLVENEEILEQDNSVATGGRRAVSYEINPNFSRCWLLVCKKSGRKLLILFRSITCLVSRSLWRICLERIWTLLR